MWLGFFGLFVLFLRMYLFMICLAESGLSCGPWGLYLQQAGSSALTSDGTQVPCTGSIEPLDQQGSPTRKVVERMRDNNAFKVLSMGSDIWG